MKVLLVRLTLLAFLMSASFFSFSQNSKQSESNVYWISKDDVITDPSVLVMEINDGQEMNGEIASGSGKKLQTELRNKLLAKSIVAIPSESFDMRESLANAKTQKMDYLIKVSIVEWENNATQWDGKPDVLKVIVDLYSVNTEKIIATATVRERTKKLIIGSRSPESLIPKAVENIINLLFS